MLLGIYDGITLEFGNDLEFPARVGMLLGLGLDGITIGFGNDLDFHARLGLVLGINEGITLGLVLGLSVAERVMS